MAGCFRGEKKQWLVGGQTVRGPRNLQFILQLSGSQDRGCLRLNFPRKLKKEGSPTLSVFPNADEFKLESTLEEYN